MKVGFDAVGIVMGLLTIPMALLGIAGVAAMAMLMALQAGGLVLFGIGAFVAFLILAWLLERLVVRIDDAAILSLDGRHRRRAYAVAVVSGALPVAVIFVSEIACLRMVLARDADAPAILVWLWGYVVATAPWTVFAERVGRFRRTLVGIRAYTGHIALWLFSILALWLHAPAVIVVSALILAAVLPFTVGLLLALADRDAIVNVRV